MRKSVAIVASISFCGFLAAAQADGAGSLPRIAEGASQATVKHVSEIRVALSQVPRTDTRSQIGDCVNVAAIRALMARASGLDSAYQNRALSSSFWLCMRYTSEGG